MLQQRSSNVKGVPISSAQDVLEVFFVPLDLYLLSERRARCVKRALLLQQCLQRLAPTQTPEEHPQSRLTGIGPVAWSTCPTQSKETLGNISQQQLRDSTGATAWTLWVLRK